MMRAARNALWLVSLSGLLALAGCSADSAEAPPPLPAYDASYLDTSAEPCTDFYQFACGTWLAQHPPEPGYQQSRFFSGDQRNSVYFRSLVQAMSSNDPSLRVAQTYYGSCLRAHANPGASSEPLRVALEAVAELSSQQDLPALLANLHDRGVHALFIAGSDIDPGDPTHYTLFISEAGFSLPARTSYDDSDLALAYQQHMVALTTLAEAGFSSLDAAAVFEFERAIAKSGTDDRNPVARYNPVDLAALSAALPGFDWSQYFSLRGYTAPRVNLYEPKALPALTALLAATPLATVKQYLAWRILEAYSGSIDKPLLAEEFAFHRGVVYGAEEAPSDEYDCFMRVREVFGFVLAHHFVDKFVSPTLKAKATGLVERLESAMQDNLARVSWLDEPTRARAQEKLAQLLPKVGYPERWPSNRFNVDPSQTFLEQRLQIARSYAVQQASSFDDVVDRHEFWASPDVTNAFYTDSRNDITIPVAVLSDPFFREERPAQFNFGVLGNAVGHELTHAFDSRGRHFDGQGALVDWWSEPTVAAFEHRSQCLVEQFNGYEALPGLDVDGQRTLDENIADLGGLIVSFAAFRAQAGRTQAPGPFSAEQQFFLAYAQTWCETAADGVTKQLLASDPHAPGRFRVNGGLRNLPQFAEAFACPAGSELAPTDRCQVW